MAEKENEKEIEKEIFNLSTLPQKVKRKKEENQICRLPIRNLQSYLIWK
jgi:hypothetical protein